MTVSFSNKNIIMFDLDGTLTASHHGILNSCRYALRHLNVEVPETSVLMKFIGPPLLESFQTFCGLDPEKAKQAVMIYREYYKEKGIYENEVYEGIPDVLRQLKDSGKKICLATSKPEIFANNILKHFDLDQYFDIICGSDLSGLRDDKTGVIGAVIEKCIEELGSTKKEMITQMIMIGDREHDVYGASSHHLPCIGVLYGYGSEEELLHAGAAVTVRSPYEIVEKLVRADDVK